MRRVPPSSLWILAVVVTAGLLIYQRTTGPTYPLRGRVTMGGQTVALGLARSHSGPTDQPVRFVAPDTAVHAELRWRRFPTSDPWDTVSFQRRGDTLVAALPHEPPAGKLAYQLRLTRQGERAIFPERPAITRFKGDISAAVVIAHLLCLFGGMILLMRAGLGALAREAAYPRQARLGLLLFGAGAFVFGPWMQYQAFGQWWTGVPLGWDATDNKVLIVAAAWAVALWRLRGGRAARGAVIGAAAVTLAAFLIPHSLFGSELDWSRAAR
jgi:hypothetical protein